MGFLRRLFGRSRDDRNLILELPDPFAKDIKELAMRLQVSPDLVVRITLKVLLQAVNDRAVRDRVQQVLETHSSGKAVCEVYGDFWEIGNILRMAEAHGDDSCLSQLMLYGGQIVANHKRGLAEASQARPAEPRTDENDIW